MKLIHYKTKTPNFGDDLNLVLWPSLAPDLFERSDHHRGFVGIGTIIGMPADDVRELHVFSSGVGYDPPTRWIGRDVTYWCVRGPLSAKMLGLDEDRAIADGAILTPLAKGFPERAQTDGATVVVPHWESLAHPGWPQALAQAGYELLDPRGALHEVIAKIASAKLVLTESLHGAILAETYGVQWRAFAASKNFSAAKWADWTLSIGRDLEFMVMPPPDANLLLAFGRRPEPFGTIVRFGWDDAEKEFGARIGSAPTPDWKATVKSWIKRAPGAKHLLGCSPARTAEALQKLAATPDRESGEKIPALQERLLERLDAVRRLPV